MPKFEIGPNLKDVLYHLLGVAAPLLVLVMCMASDQIPAESAGDIVQWVLAVLGGQEAVKFGALQVRKAVAARVTA